MTRVVISHRSHDKPMAQEVHRFLKSHGIDSYLDIHDPRLQAAVARGDDRAIADAINAGLEGCTHLLGIISSGTMKSQWVPYELGGADGRGLPAAHLVSRDVPLTCPPLPSYVLAKACVSIKGLIQWLQASRASFTLRESLAYGAASRGLANYVPSDRVNPLAP